MQGEFIFEGKKYISASRASKICGYTSDYIGQLCRKGVLDCRMVGRSWFVEEESLKNHKVVASSTPRGRISIYQKNEALKVAQNAAQKSGKSVQDGQTGHGVLLAKEALAKTEHAFFSSQQEWTNYLNESKEKKQVNQFAIKVSAGVFAVMLLVAASSVFVTNQSNILSNPLSFLSIDSEEISNVKSKLNKTFIAVKSSRSEVGDSLSYSANVFESLGLSLGESANRIIQSTYRGLAYVNNFLFDASRKVRVLVMNSNPEPRERTGVAVLPASKDEAVNAQVKQYVTDSFSDETEIVPDESGNSGLIKPVFKEKSDQEYVYVIVPVKENQN